MEEDFSCTGLFNATAYYVFTDINNDDTEIGNFPSCSSYL